MVKHCTNTAVNFTDGNEIDFNYIYCLAEDKNGVPNNMDRIKEVLNEQKRMQELRNALARQLGNDIIGR